MNAIKCFICNQDINKYPIYCDPKCKHTFHTHCIVTWYRSENNYCPCCGYSILKNDDTQRRVRRLYWTQRELCDRRIHIYKNSKDDPILKQYIDKKLNKINKIKELLKENRNKRKHFLKYVKENNLTYEEGNNYRSELSKVHTKLHDKIYNNYVSIFNKPTPPVIKCSFVDLT